MKYANHTDPTFLSLLKTRVKFYKIPLKNYKTNENEKNTYCYNRVKFALKFLITFLRIKLLAVNSKRNDLCKDIKLISL